MFKQYYKKKSCSSFSKVCAYGYTPENSWFKVSQERNKHCHPQGGGITLE